MVISCPETRRLSLKPVLLTNRGEIWAETDVTLFRINMIEITDFMAVPNSKGALPTGNAPFFSEQNNVLDIGT